MCASFNDDLYGKNHRRKRPHKLLDHVVKERAVRASARQREGGIIRIAKGPSTLSGIFCLVNNMDVCETALAHLYHGVEASFQQ